MRPPSDAAVASMLAACTERYEALVADGCAPDVARDRTWDAYERAFDGGGAHCFDPRDRLFEARLRTMADRARETD